MFEVYQHVNKMQQNDFNIYVEKLVQFTLNKCYRDHIAMTIGFHPFYTNIFDILSMPTEFLSYYSYNHTASHLFSFDYINGPIYNELVYCIYLNGSGPNSNEMCLKNAAKQIINITSNESFYKRTKYHILPKLYYMTHIILTIWKEYGLVVPILIFVYLCKYAPVSIPAFLQR